ncbi:hypothetical protein ElyMa_000482200 [Elysia marginata]|uniref:Uncharacterized protein n=1 Tax=Elysia marginata TaxID=1093978 RepID=A0AAV4FVU0_9GAST|nr:hypothetical protein ElyMa_000482200 [Elysia marginata]
MYAWPRNMPGGIAPNGKVSYSVTNLDSALTMLIAVYVYGEEAVKDTKQIALVNTTGQNLPFLLNNSEAALLSIRFCVLRDNGQSSHPVIGGVISGQTSSLWALRFDPCPVVTVSLTDHGEKLD